MSYFDESNAEFYPFKISHHEGLLIEDNGEKKEGYKPCHYSNRILGGFHDLFLVSDTMNTSLSICGIEKTITKKIYLKAKMDCGDDDKISFFGTSRAIKNFDVVISQHQCESQNILLSEPKEKRPVDDFINKLDFTSHYYDTFDYGRVFEEIVTIKIRLSDDLFSQLFDAIEKNKITFIKIGLNTECVHGLYEKDSIAPWSEYKILTHTDQVTNSSSLPDCFSSTRQKGLKENPYCEDFEIYLLAEGFTSRHRGEDKESSADEFKLIKNKPTPTKTEKKLFHIANVTVMIGVATFAATFIFVRILEFLGF